MSLNARCTIYGTLWICAAITLAWRALPYLGLEEQSMIQGLEDSMRPYALACALGIGLMKGLTVLKKAARRAISRMKRYGDQAPLKTIFDLKTFATIIGMVTLGVIVRTAHYPAEVKAWVVSIVYPGVALGLSIGSIKLLTYREKLRHCDEQ